MRNHFEHAAFRRLRELDLRFFNDDSRRKLLNDELLDVTCAACPTEFCCFVFHIILFLFVRLNAVLLVAMYDSTRNASMVYPEILYSVKADLSISENTI